MTLAGNTPPCNQAGDCPTTTWLLHDLGHDGSKAEFFGETFQHQSDISGGPNSRTDFLNTEEKWSGAWGSYAYDGLADDCSFYRHALVTSREHFQIWTDPINRAGATC